MSKTKKIYFLSTLVMIIGCFALNLSYSLFVQTEEKEVVESVVPSLDAQISLPNITLNENAEYIVKETITNNGTVALNYALKTEGVNYSVKLVNKDNNNVVGLLEPNTTIDVYLYLKNESTEANTINFVLDKNYTTLNNNLTTNINTDDKYNIVTKNISMKYLENTLNYKILNGSIEKDEKELTLSSNDIEQMLLSVNSLKLPIFNDNNINIIEDFNIDITDGLYKTNDNYGISYYYRGNIVNNYVTLANKLWRIVRINGNGSIRLISNDSISTATYNDLDDMTYSGNIKDIVDKWYENNLLKDYSNYLTDTVYCVDNDANSRINENKPILICKNTEENILEYSVSNNNLKYPIGLITTDEVLLGSTYLNKENSYWTMTPSSNKEIFVASKVLEKVTKDEANQIYPVINLKENILATSGDGTETNPYVVSIEAE